MDLTPRPLTFSSAEHKGLSERLLASHHANNYSGAVKRLNAIRSQPPSLDFASAPGFQPNGLKREELIATNPMLLHELYFASLGGDGKAFAASQDDVAEAQVLDVRRAGMFDKAETLIPGAKWRDPAAVDAWARDLPADKEIVVYCVYGHEVGRATALRLRSQGLKARFLRGGIDGWQAAGRPVDPKGTAS
jgi:rhodanese-related sulfurtransferase